MTLHELPIGYLVGVTDTAAHRTCLKRYRKASLAAMAIEATARHPLTLLRLLLTRVRLVLARRLAQTHKPAMDISASLARLSPMAVLSHLIVAEDFRGQGHGSRLGTTFIENARLQGARSVAVATAFDDVAAGAFYERHGWRLIRSRITFDGRRIQLHQLLVAGTSVHATAPENRRTA